MNKNCIHVDASQYGNIYGGLIAFTYLYVDIKVSTVPSIIDILYQYQIFLHLQWGITMSAVVGLQLYKYELLYSYNTIHINHDLLVSVALVLLKSSILFPSCGEYFPSSTCNTACTELLQPPLLNYNLPLQILLECGPYLSAE